MPGSTRKYATVDDWIAHEAIAFSLDDSESFNAAVDKTVSALGGSVDLLGLGEPLHGGDEFLVLRNRLLERLVEAHGYGAIAIESSFTRALVVNAYIAGQGPAAYEAVQDSGFSHGFGQLDANRELVEWMRLYNADPSHPVKLRFYGIDAPTEAYSTASPRQTLHFVLDYLAALDNDAEQKHRQLIEPLIGADAGWENPAVLRDPSKAIGLSPAAAALRIATEDLATDMRIRRPELVAKGGRDRYLEALHHASIARQLLSYHAALAGRPRLLATLLGIRDAMMAENLTYIAAREQGRGKVLIFAHNAHLQRGKAVRPWNEFWPVGSQLDDMFGPRYAVIGSALGTSDANGIGRPEAGTLEARFMSKSGPGHFILTHKGHDLPAAEIAALPTRAGSARNPGYSPLSTRSLTDFDCLAVLQSATYTRGAPPLPASNAAPEQT